MYANNLEMPAILYLSSDDDAPALTKSNLSLILKACLVTGYGSKPGAGWTMPHEDAAAGKRVFAPTKTGELDSYLLVHDQNGQSRIAAWRDYAAIDNAPPALELATPYKHGQGRQWSGRWAVIATARGVVMWVEDGYNAAQPGMMLYYGDTSSTDNGSRALILAHSGGDYSDGSHGSLFHWPGQPDSDRGFAQARSYRDDGGAQPQLFVRPVWRQPAWAKPAPALTIPANLILSVSGQRRISERANAVRITPAAELVGGGKAKGGLVYREGTDQQPEASTLTHAAYTDSDVMRAAGIHALSETGTHKTETVQLPWTEKYQLPLATLGAVWAFAEAGQTWQGVVKGVSVAVELDNGAPVVTQTVTIDRYLGD